VAPRISAALLCDMSHVRLGQTDVEFRKCTLMFCSIASREDRNGHVFGPCVVSVQNQSAVSKSASFAAANGKRCFVFRADLFPLQPNIADKFRTNVAGPTQGVAAGQTVCLFRRTQLA
jgi:hypothetical protein